MATLDNYPLGTSCPAPDGTPGLGLDDLLYHRSDLVAAVIAGALVTTGGPDALHVGLHLARAGHWGLAELCDVTSELTPGTNR